MAPQVAPFNIDRIRQIGGQGDKPVVRDVVHPFDHFGNRPARSGHFTRLAIERNRNVFFLARNRIFRRHILRLNGQITHLQPVVEKRVGFVVNAQRQVIRYRVPNRHQAIGQPIAEPIAVEQGHDHIDIGLELNEPLARVRHRSLPDTVELDPVMLFKTLAQGHKIGRVHGKAIGMAGIIHDLIDIAGHLAVHRAGPKPLDGLADDDHRAAIFGIPILHGLEGRDHLVVIIRIV